MWKTIVCHLFQGCCNFEWSTKPTVVSRELSLPPFGTSRRVLFLIALYSLSSLLNPVLEEYLVSVHRIASPNSKKTQCYLNDPWSSYFFKKKLASRETQLQKWSRLFTTDVASTPFAEIRQSFQSVAFEICQSIAVSFPSFPPFSSPPQSSLESSEFYIFSFFLPVPSQGHLIWGGAEVIRFSVVFLISLSAVRISKTWNALQRNF